MIAALVLSAAVGAISPDNPMRVWYLHGNVNRTQATYRIESRQTAPGHDSSFSDDHTIGLGSLASTLAGLTVEQLYSAGMHVRFENRRDAGTLSGEGWAANGSASGNFTLALNPAYARELARRGIGTPTPEEQERLVLEDGTYALLDALHEFGYRQPTVAQFLRMLDHGVDLAYVKEMQSAGLSPHSIDGLVTARDHGVDAEYVRTLRTHGINGSLEDFVRARDHGVDGAQVAGFAKLGYTALSLDQLIRLCDHGVTVSYAEHMRARGYPNLSVDDLIRLRDQGI